MNDVRHRIVASNGIRLHVAEAGSGPVVLLIHGFPESWYSWRYQLPALAAAGYHAVALDVRGYGRSSKPTTVPDYRMVKKVGDVVGLVAESGRRSGDHRRPRLGCADRVDERAVAAGSVSRRRWAVGAVCTARRRRPVRDRPSGCARWQAKQTNSTSSISSNRVAPKRRSKPNVREWLLGFYWCASGDVRNGPNISIVPRGTKLRDKFVYPETMPHWLSEADLDVYTREFEYSGFFGPLSRYRNVDRDWEDLAGLRQRPITIPALFIGGSRDGPTIWGNLRSSAFPKRCRSSTRARSSKGPATGFSRKRRRAPTNC